MRTGAFDVDGWYAGARHSPSRNCDERPDPADISLIVIHCISLPPGEFGGDAVERFFLNRLAADEHPYYDGIRDLEVSAHFFVRREGELVQFVPCRMRAWHAGVSGWCGRERCNDFSVGIELEGTDDRPYTDAQYDTLLQLTYALLDTYPITDIAGHSDVAPGRKTDPGPHFDWVRYRASLTRPG